MPSLWTLVLGGKEVFNNNVMVNSKIGYVQNFTVQICFTTEPPPVGVYLEFPTYQACTLPLGYIPSPLFNLILKQNLIRLVRLGLNSCYDSV